MIFTLQGGRGDHNHLEPPDKTCSINHNRVCDHTWKLLILPSTDKQIKKAVTQKQVILPENWMLLAHKSIPLPRKLFIFRRVSNYNTDLCKSHFHVE